MPAGLDGHPEPVRSEERDSILSTIASLVIGRAEDRLLIGIDGASGTGKSTLADELARFLIACDRDVVRASIDSFHRPRVERYRRGEESPEGYYRDSHDLDALRGELLVPFAAGASSVRTEVFDEPNDTPIEGPPTAVPRSAILVVDGLFLHRRELVDLWDLSIFLTAEHRRASLWAEHLQRDLTVDEEQQLAEVERRRVQARHDRYVQGQALYEEEADPIGRATLVIDNDNLVAPVVIAANW